MTPSLLPLEGSAATDERPADEHSGPSRDAVFSILSSQRRRDTIELLREHGTLDVSALATLVAAREYDVPVEQVGSAQRKRVYVSLRQTHLPKLASEGVIRTDRSFAEIDLAADADRLAPYLDTPTEELPWSTFYLALAALSALFVLGVSLGVLPLGGVAAAALIAGVFLVAAVAHTLSDAR